MYAIPFPAFLSNYSDSVCGAFNYFATNLDDSDIDPVFFTFSSLNNELSIYYNQPIPSLTLLADKTFTF